MTALPMPDESNPTRIRFTNPNFDDLERHIRSAAVRGLPMVRRNGYAGAQGAVVCGSGPSLTIAATLKRIGRYLERGWHVIACKEAIRLLVERGVRVDFSVSMDPGEGQGRKTHRDAGIVYCVASSCHPALFDHLLGDELTVWLFHSACGCAGEAGLYRALFPCGDVMQGGYTVVNRAVSLAKYMGFPKIALAGADFGWRPGRDELDQLRAENAIDEAVYRRAKRSARTGGYYARGAREAAGNAGANLTDHGMVDGKPWMTRPDLLASAVAIARASKRGQIDTILGDSLAAALARRDEEFLKRVLPEG